MKTEQNSITAIILAAGLGTRMKSQKPKVLHEILDKPMVLYVVETARQVARGSLIIVIGGHSEKVRDIILKHCSAMFAFQKNQLGTGHAVMAAMPHVSETVGQLIIMCGDVPLLRVETLKAMLKDHIESDRDLSVLGVDLENPKGYGRLVFDEHRNVSRIVEEGDATEAQKQIKTINAGTYCIKKAFLIDALKQIRPNNIQGEFYLTDIIEIGYRTRKCMGVFIGSNAQEIKGINTLEDLKDVENMLREINIKTS